MNAAGTACRAPTEAGWKPAVRNVQRLRRFANELLRLFLLLLRRRSLARRRLLALLHPLLLLCVALLHLLGLLLVALFDLLPSCFIGILLS